MIGREKEKMQRVTNLYILGVMLLVASSAAFGQDATFTAKNAGAEKRFQSEFEGRVRQYTKRREELENQLPPMPKQATAEQIAAHKAALLKKVLENRKGVVRGHIFTPDAEAKIRAIITSHYRGRDRLEMKKELAEAENKTVPVKVNGVYPEAAELLEMPPTLLLALPQLPKQVRYRFVGNNLLLVDRENHLIVDYMTNALP